MSTKLSRKTWYDRSISVGCHCKGVGKAQRPPDIDEKCYEIVGKKRKLFIKVDKKYFRPLDINYLRGDYTKAKKVLRFKPKYKFIDLVKEMLLSDIEKYNYNNKF